MNVEILANQQLFKMDIKRNEKLKTKQMILPGNPSDIRISVSGEGCVLLQVNSKFVYKLLVA